jgi:hypothetical protein
MARAIIDIKKTIPIILILLVLGQNGYSQIEYSGKIEIGYLKFINNTILVDPGPNWKGYNLENENGIDFNLINGIKFKNKFLAGIGIGYLNFEGINGYSIFTDFEHLPLETKLTPLINLKIGYNHIWNQYENGTGSAFIEISGGLNYNIYKKINVYLQAGFLLAQQSFLIPISLGFRF